MVKISTIVPGGIADSLGLQVADQIVQANSRPVRDFLDVLLAERLPDVELLVEKPDGDLWQLDIEKEADQPFGFVLEHPEPEHCGNNCLFCFVHQLPKGLRRTLYVKDEDYRFSYLYGAYITLSNLTDGDIERIIEQQLSPLYVSVHATDEALRSRLLGRPAPPIMPILRRLVENGIEIHAQIVVCPGVNDDEALDETVAALYQFFPGVRTLALVPVGLTKHRQNLPALQPMSKENATAVLAKIDGWQSVFKRQTGHHFIYAADEFYLRAGAEVPPLETYEDLAQIENGVGMIAVFRDAAGDVLKEAADLDCPVEFSVVTGKAFSAELESFLVKLSELTGCKAHIYAIENRLFGDMVTVAGLVSGGDIIRQVEGKKLGSVLFVPDVMMQDGTGHFLDDLTPKHLADQLGCRVRVIEDSPWGLLDAIEELTAE
jgi:putative radical SAM enzyme (TIGR03279 family)